MNKVILCGRPTTNPNVNNIRDDLKKAVFTLAVDRGRRGKEGQSAADFIRIICFGNQADIAEKYINQGDMVAVSGRIQTGSYNDKNGNKVYTTDVYADNVELMYKHVKVNAPAPATASTGAVSTFEDMDDDDDALPFN